MKESNFNYFKKLNSTLGPNTAAITFEQFKSSVCLYPFNLNPDFDTPKESEYINLAKDGFINI